jgi:hypothetical protein
MQQHCDKKNKSAILNIQKRKPVKKNKFSALKTSKIKTKTKQLKGFCSLFPRLVPFLGLVHFLYCTLCTYNVKQSMRKCPT